MRSYGSLHQKDADGQRTAPEAAAFGTALRTMGMWYAHRLTTTYIMSQLPAGWPRTAEAAPFFPEGWLAGKGWPSFERAVSGMVKSTNVNKAVWNSSMIIPQETKHLAKKPMYSRKKTNHVGTNHCIPLGKPNEIHQNLACPC